MEINKLIELINNEEGELAFTIAKGLGLSMELLNTFWDTERNGDEHGMLYIKGVCLEWDGAYQSWYCDSSVPSVFNYVGAQCHTFEFKERNKVFKLFIDELNKLSE